MDAPEEDLDIKLQQVAGDLIADFDRSIELYLRKTDGVARPSTVRRRVRSRETYRLTSTLLDPFQELPQLLDPHLPKWLPLIAESFLEYLRTRRPSKPLSTRSNLLMPLSAGICVILYTFCKMRGEKVIVRFLNNETKYLELLLSALEEAERRSSEASHGWKWEERYVVLLWLSHLLLAPFDLATISSVEVEDEDLPDIPGFRWPPNIPGITARVLPLAIKYLESPGKERDAAKTLLVRIAMRRDMQALGVLDALVQWCLFVLRSQEVGVPEKPYYYIGVLSFLNGILVSSSDTSDMIQYLSTIFDAVQPREDYLTNSSAVARKSLIKVNRSIVLQLLRHEQQDEAKMNMVETTIGYLLEMLADNDTPVRLAASKALATIALKLDMEMAAQVVEAVLESLNRNVLWTKSSHDLTSAPAKDLSAVNPLEWHGLMLTLSHLLYRRSPPAANLGDILQALLMGLSFEQRSMSGGTIGTNVRDAACFGIWALARRYTTKELLEVKVTSLPMAGNHPAGISVLQILATELILTASLDPAGNIRRGSSAALQELIGRHPDTVDMGIWVVQTVDYHAVALRARATQEVALNVSKLARRYGQAMLEALLAWRGIGDSDVAARRVAAASFGVIVAELAKTSQAPMSGLGASVCLVVERLKALQQRQVDERHGLLLALAAVLDHIPMLTAADVAVNRVSPETKLDNLVKQTTSALENILTECKDKTYRRPELIAEAASSLVISSLPVVQAAILGSKASIPLQPGPALLSMKDFDYFDQFLSALDSADIARRQQIRPLLSLIDYNLNEWLKRREQETTDFASKAALVYLAVSGPAVRETTIRAWIEAVRQRHKARSSATAGGGYVSALIMAYQTVHTTRDSQQGLLQQSASLIREAILERWTSDVNVEARVSVLRSLTGSELLRRHAPDFLEMVADGLDDYRTDARGDIGSHVRLQAIRATKSLWEALRDDRANNDQCQLLVSELFLKILRLAAEKLDRVRVEAQATLALAMKPEHATRFTKLTFSSRPYFLFLLDLHSQADQLHPSVTALAAASPAAWGDALMAGYVSSADTGNEDLVVASRAALAASCQASADAERDNKAGAGAALARNLRAFLGNDRVIVSTLEIIAFLLRVGLFRITTDGTTGGAALCAATHRACYKTGNVRKLEASTHVYAAIAANSGGGQKPGVREARRRLGALMYHPWPRVRAAVVDELWGLISAASEEEAKELLGVDWGRAEKMAIKKLVEKLELV